MAHLWGLLTAPFARFDQGVHPAGEGFGGVRVACILMVVLAAGCAAPSPAAVIEPDPVRVSEPAEEGLPAGATYAGTWLLASPTLGIDNGRSYSFTLTAASNVTIIVDVRGDGALDAGASIALADAQGRALGPIVASTGGSPEKHRELTALLIPGSYLAHGDLRSGALADFTMTVSFAP